MNKQLTNLKKEYQNFIISKDKESNKISNIRLVIFIIFIISLILSFKTHSLIFKISNIFLIILFIIIVIYHHKIDMQKKQKNKYLDIINNYEKRSNGTWQTIDSDYINNNIDFMNDLNIIGHNSLFQFLNFTSTLGGNNKLIDNLSLKNPTNKNILLNQEAIKELKDNFKFSLYFQEKYSTINNSSNTDYKEYFYLFKDKVTNKHLELIVSLILSLITLILAILTLLNIIPSFYFIGLFVLQLFTSYVYTLIYNEEFSIISKCTRKYHDLEPIYKFINSSSFTSSKLSSLKEDIDKGKQTLSKLIKLSSLDGYRLNFLTYVFLNSFASLNQLIIYKYRKLLKEETNQFKNSIAALEEIEVLISLSTICYVKESICLPEINKDLSLEVTNMKHPLLAEEKCISNNFNCSEDINIITGSNMSGKTSFMRTIGINLVLAYNGTYVNAKTFSCPIMKIFTSINVKDDISNGISTFYGELKRIKNILDYSSTNKMPMIIFIDEIFKGTNYNDRIYGAKEILKKLSSLNCIVFLTTHDFELCEVKNKKINNYHFKEYYNEDKIYFDYKIKEGKCNTTNAKYLMSQMHLID